MRRRKSIARYTIVFPAHGHPLLALTAGLTVPDSNDMTVSHKTKIDRPWHALSLPHTFEGRDVLVSQDMVQFISHYLCAFHLALSPNGVFFFCLSF